MTKGASNGRLLQCGWEGGDALGFQADVEGQFG